VLSRTNKYVHQLVNIDIYVYIKMHGATIKITNTIVDTSASQP